MKEGKALGVPWLEAGGLGKLELGQHEQGILGNWFRETVWLILIATKVEAQTKKKN